MREPLFARGTLLGLFVLACACSDPAEDGPVPGTLGGPCGAGCAAGLACASGLCVAESDAGAPDLGPTDLGVLDLGVVLDAGPPDLGPPDLGPPDTGALGPCAPRGSACVEARECGSERPGASNCPFCPPDHLALCVDGACEDPPTLEFSDIQEVGFSTTGDLSGRVQSLVGVVIARGTSGGLQLGCEDIRRPGFDLSNGCYNVLTTRLITISQPSQTYSFPYGRFASGQEVLLLVYGFEQTTPVTPVGVSCTPATIGPPGSGRNAVSGEPMLPL